MQHGFVFVYAEIFGDVLLVELECCGNEQSRDVFRKKRAYEQYGEKPMNHGAANLQRKSDICNKNGRKDLPLRAKIELYEFSYCR